MKYKVKNATERLVQGILKIDTADVNKMNRRVWSLPESEIIEEDHCISECLKKLESVWNRDSESTTRTFIDLILLDILSRQNFDFEFKFNCFGEVSGLKYPENPSENDDWFSGRADYFLGYGLGAKSLETLLICVEAKAGNGRWNIWQLIAYMGIIHKKRQEKSKINANVYGIFTNSINWQFFRIDNTSKVWASDTINITSRRNEIWSWMSYIIDISSKSTPTNSMANLKSLEHHFERDIEQFRIVDYATSKSISSVSQGNSADQLASRLKKTVKIEDENETDKTKSDSEFKSDDETNKTKSDSESKDGEDDSETDEKNSDGKSEQGDSETDETEDEDEGETGKSEEDSD